MKAIAKRLSYLLPVVLIILGLAISCDNQPTNPDNENTISGQLIDEQGTGVASAQIDVYRPNGSGRTDISSAMSDENGMFILNNIPTDMTGLKVKITHMDFVPTDESLVEFKSKTQTPVPLNHQDTCKGVLNIYTFKKNDSTTLKDVEIRLFKSGTLIRKGLSSQGMISFTNVCPGDYVIQYKKYHFETAYDTLESVSTDTINRHMYMTQTENDSCCNGVITITVKDSVNGNPISGVKGYLSQSGTYITGAYSDSEGKIVFKDLCPGEFVIKLAMSGYNYNYVTFNLNCNDTLSSDAYLSAQQSNPDSCCKGVMKVFLIDKSTGKAPTASVSGSLVKDGKVIQSQSGTSYIYFSHICEGSYQIHLTSGHYETLKFDYTSNCNSVDTTTKYLTATQKSDSCCKGVIDVVVKDSATKAVIKSASVYLYLGGTKIAALSTDANGKVRFTNVCEGDYTIKSSISGYNLGYTNHKMGCNDTTSLVQYISKQGSKDTCCTGKLTVTVIDSTTSAAVSGATVYMIKADGTSVTGTTDASGVCVFENVCAPTTYKVKAIKTDYNYSYVQVAFHTCNTQSITLQILKK